jgi:hypothetical protein
LPEAAVATGTLAIASKLPGSDASVGTAAQPAPNCVISIGAAALGATVVGVVAIVVGVAVAVSAVESPQAAVERANRVAAEMAVSFVVRIGVDPFVMDFLGYSAQKSPEMCAIDTLFRSR